MGMNLNFSLEDINIEITTDEDTDTTDEQIEAAEQQEDVEEASEEVEAVARYGMQLADIHQNLTFIKKHVQMFGVTKQMLHLVNNNGQLSSAIGLALPHYESDDEAEDITMDDVPEAEVVVESISEKLNSWKDAVVKFFKMLYEKIKDLGKAILTRVTGLKKSLVRIDQRLKGKIDETKYNNLAEVTAYTNEEWDERWNACSEILAYLTNKVKDKIGDTSTIVDSIKNQMKTLGKNIEMKDEALSVSSDSSSTGPKKIKQASEWDIRAIKSSITFCKQYVDTESKADVTKSFKTIEASLLKTLQAKNDATDKIYTEAKENLSKQKTIVTKNTAVCLSCWNNLHTEKLSLIRMFIAIANRIPMANEKK